MNIHLFVGLLLSVAIGISLGLMGGGGSIITVPVLVYVIGVDVHQAIGISLVVVGITSLIGVLLHHKKGTVDFPTGILFGISGMPTAYIGTHLKYFFSQQILLIAFAILMLVISILMLSKKQNSEKVFKKEKRNIIKSVVVGLTVGLLTGILGVGGGFIIAPALVLFAGLEMKNAIGTSLLIIAINCAAGFIGDLHHSQINIQTAFLVTFFAAVGTIAGTKLSHKTSPENLRKSFAVFVIAVAVFLIYKETHHF